MPLFNAACEAVLRKRHLARFMAANAAKTGIFRQFQGAQWRQFDAKSRVTTGTIAGGPWTEFRGSAVAIFVGSTTEKS